MPFAPTPERNRITPKDQVFGIKAPILPLIDVKHTPTIKALILPTLSANSPNPRDPIIRPTYRPERKYLVKKVAFFKWA